VPTWPQILWAPSPAGGRGLVRLREAGTFYSQAIALAVQDANARAPNPGRGGPRPGPPPDGGCTGEDEATPPMVMPAR
jgi:hypothetical protein